MNRVKRSSFTPLGIAFVAFDCAMASLNVTRGLWWAASLLYACAVVIFALTLWQRKLRKRREEEGWISGSQYARSKSAPNISLSLYGSGILSTSQARALSRSLSRALANQPPPYLVRHQLHPGNVTTGTNEPEEPELELAFERDAIIGYRLWHVTRTKRRGGLEEPRLASLGVPAYWPPLASQIAICVKSHSDHESPWPSCDCGFWAFKTPDQLQSALTHYGATVWGEVAMWGRVLECEHGWRAERAYPRRLAIFGSEDQAAELARIYGVPVSAIENESPRYGELDDVMDATMIGGSRAYYLHYTCGCAIRAHVLDDYERMRVCPRHPGPPTLVLEALPEP